MYNPISVEFFDQLEVAIQRAIPSTIIYLDKEEEKQIKGVVKTLEVIDYKEFLVLKTNVKIQLSEVLSFNGKVHRKI